MVRPQRNARPAWQAFTKAIELTPYDPDVYLSRLSTQRARSAEIVRRYGIQRPD
jgi:hypothetical protein